MGVAFGACRRRSREELTQNDMDSCSMKDSRPASAGASQWYAFDLSDEANWLEQLRGHGFVVIRGVATADQVQTAKSLLWDSIGERSPHLVRDDPKTWDFFLNPPGLAPWLTQSAGAWAVRGWPGVKQAFARIWETEELIVSMDCVLLWRPWWLNNEWTPWTEGLHLDQNPFHKPELECIQGMVPLVAVTEASGGLQVVPGSNLDTSKEGFKLTHLHMRSSGDWCPCDDDKLKKDALLVQAEPGDLILWDARTVHGGHVGHGQCEQRDPAELARLSVTVSMTPRSWASDVVQKRRREGFTKGESFNHIPHEAGTGTGVVRAPVRQGFRPPVLTDEQQALL